ncbi:putative ATP-dependent RNA helicase TDRD12 isoform X1 [Athalia rosae]|uniref:putative ATP-dependent RNA helicase TDRD12 isoform X1 n=2 Tax=Athalia rosae TaxID=37344 RepID=UPI0020339B1C|nr:putative ATP-dependent RNA helicase TDRD12 isoform X1 [Athalia rosae]XP_048509269.1 putative ATP-dependent RNA helicase TDRD12 isoform X1 [Athalia rosae]XP_048509270.1 putative ATP-dependent RNA helicase TDRD12 isoform X1 [Athalia rosae]
MDESEFVANDLYIPSTAMPVVVTNVINPFHLRIYQSEGYDGRMSRLERELHQLANTKLLEYGEHSQPHIGDMVIVDNKYNFNVELPAWYCRGVVGSERTPLSKYRVFLPDYGIAVESYLEDLRILPPCTISNLFLTFTIGIAGIIPITSADDISCISESWSDSAIQFTKDIIGASALIYFDHLRSDDCGNMFGELYLVLENQIITLSKELAFNQFATVISESQIEITKKNDTLTQISNGCSMIKLSDPTCNVSGRAGVGATKKNKAQTKHYKNTAAVYDYTLERSLRELHQVDSDTEILIHSNTVWCEQLNSVSEARFPENVHKALRSLSISRLMRLQRYVWPAIIKGFNVVAVNSPKSGKTYSYLVPLVSSVAASKKNMKVCGVNGPLTLIVCASCSDVVQIFEACTKLLEDYDGIKILAAYNGIKEKSLMAKIYNGCEILIAMAPYLTRLIKYDRKLLNFNRLMHLVFDEADIILDKYHNSLGEILKFAGLTSGRRSTAQGVRPLQIIAVARHWTPLLELLVRGFIKDPYVCIGSFMEAVVYASLKPKLIICHKNHKAAMVIELLDNRWPLFKTVIACATTNEARELNKFLKSASIPTLLADDDMIFTAIRGVKETWAAGISGEYSVLVCTDSTVPELNIRDAEWLIHYSLSSSTKTQFFYRFSMLTNIISRRIRTKQILTPKFILMVDESNETQLRTVITIMRRLKTRLPSATEAYLEKIFLATEMAKTNFPLCYHVKAFGVCRQKDSCKNRHCVIPTVDRLTTSIKVGDSVRLVITYVHDASHYSARITEYTRMGSTERVPFSFREFADLTVNMQKYFSNPTSRRYANPVNVGDICAVEETLGNYKRVEVLSIIDETSFNMPVVNVRFIDDGDVSSLKAYQLLQLPENLARWPSHIVEVYLTGIVPFDDEPTWSPYANTIAYKWLRHKLANTSMSYTIAKVQFHIGNTLWVDKFEVRHKLENGYPDLTECSLKATLIHQKCAIENTNHLQNLLDLYSPNNMLKNSCTVFSANN